MIATSKTTPSAKRHRAPGRHERKGLTLVDVIRKFPDNPYAELIADGPAARKRSAGSSGIPAGHPL